MTHKLKLSLALSILSGMSALSLGLPPNMVLDGACAKQSLASAERPPEVNLEKMGERTFSVATVAIAAPPDKVWKLLLDYDHAAGKFPTLEKCKLVEDRGGEKIVSYTIRPSDSPISYSYVLQVKVFPTKYMEWHRLSGSFKAIEGFWKLEAQQGGKSTLVTYGSFVDGGFFLPQPLIREQVKSDIPAVLTALKRHSESGVEVAGRLQNSSNQ